MYYPSQKFKFSLILNFIFTIFFFKKKLLYFHILPTYLQIIANLFTEMEANNKETFLYMCDAKLFKFQWQILRPWLEKECLGPGSVSMSPLSMIIQEASQIYSSKFYQKEPSRGVLSKRCSENMQQIYRRTPMPKCDFSKATLQFYWNCTLAWVFCCIFAAYFQNVFY